MDESRVKQIKTFLMIAALTGLGLGLSDSVFANYFKDAYQADAFMRGIIELPREIPGVLCVFLVAALSFMDDIKLAILAQILSVLGLLALGFFTPAFGIMLIFLFVNSMGQHMYIPLSDSLGMSLADGENYGAAIGKINGMRTAFSMLSGILVFAGFRLGFFSFHTPIKAIFLYAAAIFCVITALFFRFRRLGYVAPAKDGKKLRLVFRREYGTFYLLAILFGARKQIMFVYGPWVLIELLGFGPDIMALLTIAGSAIGIFFLPAVGKWIDRFGTSRIMMLEAAAFFGIYALYGFLSAGLSAGWLAAAGLTIAAALAVNILDRMTIQFGMVRSVYMKSIASKPEDVTPTLSVGMMLDHIVSVLGALVCGYLWKQWGPQYVFIMASLMAVANFLVAMRIKNKALVARGGSHG